MAENVAEIVRQDIAGEIIRLSETNRTLAKDVAGKLSTGEIRISPDAMITGEGKDRKIHLTTTSDDPAILDFMTWRKMHEDVFRGQDKNDPAIILRRHDSLNLTKRVLMGRVFSEKAFGPLMEKWQNIRRANHVLGNGDLGKELVPEEKELHDLINYSSYLVDQDAVELTIQKKPRTNPISRLLGKRQEVKSQ